MTRTFCKNFSKGQMSNEIQGSEVENSRTLNFDIHLESACLREAPACGTKAGILAFLIL